MTAQGPPPHCENRYPVDPVAVSVTEEPALTFTVQVPVGVEVPASTQLMPLPVTVPLPAFPAAGATVRGN